jgi:DNA-binding MarR family transcriptional regulator
MPDMPETPCALLMIRLAAGAQRRLAETLEPYGLKPSHYGVVSVLVEEGALFQQRLAALLRTDPSRVVGLVDELEAGGHVERTKDPRDRRRYAVRLTAEGHRLAARLATVAGRVDDELLAGLEPAERRLIGPILRHALRSHP